MLLAAALALGWSAPLPRLHASRRALPRCALDPTDLELVLRELEKVRDFVSADVAAAAMVQAREKRTIDAFISELQDEVADLGAEIDDRFELVELNLEEQAGAMAREKRAALASRAEALLEELEASAPSREWLKELDAEDVGRYKSPHLPLGARVVVAGVDSAFGALLCGDLARKGYEVVRGSDTCPIGCADPTLPASGALRRELDGADAIVFVCAGAAESGVAPTLLAAASRVLPPTLRRALLVSPRGVDRTFDLAFALRNAMGGLDRQRAAEQAMAAGCERAGATYTVMRAQLERGQGATVGASGFRLAPTDFRLAPGDALDGAVDASAVSEAALQALRRKEAFGARFSIAAAGRADAGGRAGRPGTRSGGALGRFDGAWDDEFIKLVGPEVGRFATARPVPVEWVRAWARRLDAGSAGARDGAVSAFAVYDLPSAASAAAARSVAAALPSGARIRFLASGVEFVGADEEERVKGDFDGAIDVIVERSRVRVVRAEMEPVWRRGTDGSRRQVSPLVKVTSEAYLLKRLAEDLREFG